ncbi:Receptor-type tyrosine- phosphatase delta [Paramuricea clavata]|uniref:Receptor-type tyrosine- phosphatase delta n=1 Tax=Paramuricea clavata TaxID=317549 RepID=A0A6S7FH55_PARCT|nr:Receptor-type tyrosine- phosphatase delta [Paramuricea clavata]
MNLATILYSIVPSGPPLNIKTTSRSASSLSFTWDPPEKDKQNGVIISYTACVSHSENGHCFQTFATNKREWVARHLTASTKYYVRILASTKVGHGNYSESRGFFTNEKAAEKAIAETSSTLTFSLQIPSKTIAYFYMVALKLKDGKEPTSSGSYENSEFVTYAEARKSTNSKPYIAAVVTSSGVDGKMFVLGDGRNTSDPTSRRRRSTSSNYYNGPLEPGSSYSIFQRIVLSDKVEYYSTDWSPASKTSEYAGSPSILIKTSSGDIKAKEGDLVNLLCSAEGEPPIIFNWEKDQKLLESFMEKDKPHRSSLLVVTVKDQTSFGKYTCHIRDRFESTTYTMSVLKDTRIDNPTSGTPDYKNDDGSEIYLVGIIILAILLIILVFILTYFICQNRRLKSKANVENKTQSRNISDDTYRYADEDGDNYQDVKNEQPTSTALERLEDEENADHIYSQLNDYVQEEETGM